MRCAFLRTRGCFARVLVVGMLVARAGAAAADWELVTLAMEGDPDPVGGAIDFIAGEVSIDDGRVGFWGHAGGDTRIWVVEGGVLAVAVAQGDAAPDTGGSPLTDVGRARLAGPDALAWSGAVAGGRGAFQRSGATELAMALPGDALPAGGTILEAPFVHSAASGPRFAFGAEVDAGGPGSIAAHLAYGPSGLREVYREGGAAPAPVGGVFSPVASSEEAAIAADGSVTFVAAVSGGSAASGLFRSSTSGTVAPLLLEGDVVTTPGGGTFTGFGGAAVNGAGDVAFHADVLRAPAAFSREAVFALEGGVQREIAIRGDAVPGAPPAAPLFGGVSGSSPPEIGGTGVVAFTATLEDAALTASARAVVVDDGGDLAVLVAEGDPVPDAPGASFLDFTDARVDAQGRIAIHATTTQGAGVFLARRPAPIPGLPWWGLAGAAALLGRRPGSGPSRGRGARRQGAEVRA